MITLKYRNSLHPAEARELDQVLASLNAFLRVAHNADGTLVLAQAASVSEETGLPIGLGPLPFMGTVAPAGWLMCDGSAVSRATYAALFAEIGITSGAGDGSTTFNLPDMRQRFPLGKAAAGTGSTLGGSGGAIDHTHAGPSHTHPLTTGAPSATTVVASGVGATVASSTHTHAGPTDAAGAGNTGAANPPFIAVNYIILAQ